MSRYARYLRTIGDDKAFYFYKDIGEYIGIKANNLEEFINVLQELDLEVIEFHMKRGDFEKWIRDVIGDKVLARSLSIIKAKGYGGEKLKNEVISRLKRRYEVIKRKAGF